MQFSDNVKKRPNFFILGAPKCGTTSLASWLSTHPNIFMSTPKEPEYFNTDYAAPGRPHSLEKYEQLFAEATPKHKAIGEASTGYLRSEKAVPAILKYAPSACFIVCLRNPIEMVQSEHAQMVKMGIETEVSFERAWALQEVRCRGYSIPKACHDSKALLYGQTCKLGKQMERLFYRVSPKDVLVILLEEMKLNPRGEYKCVMNFLLVDDDGRKDFPIVNARKLPHFPKLAQGLRLVWLLKKSMGLRQGLGIGSLVQRWNNYPAKSALLSPEVEATLRNYFKKDIELLGQVIGRNLSNWFRRT